MFKKSTTAFVLIMACLTLSGCNMLPFGKDSKTDSLADLKIKSGPVIINQNLPVKKLTIKSKDSSHGFEVEIANNEEQRQVGLMNRMKLDEDKGMIFIFEKSGLLDFWMKNTLIPLDMLFIDQTGIIQHIARNVQPCKKDPCPLYNSQKVVRYVLEISGGVSDKSGIKEGDKVSW